jgi:hypothetical protein
MADKADTMLPMDRFDADFHGAADIAVSPDNYAALRNLADIERMERVPFEMRARPLSSFGLIRRGAMLDRAKTALHVLRNGDPAQAIGRVSYADLLANIIRAANLFRSLGVGEADAAQPGGNPLRPLGGASRRHRLFRQLDAGAIAIERPGGRRQSQGACRPRPGG